MVCALFIILGVLLFVVGIACGIVINCVFYCFPLQVGWRFIVYHDYSELHLADMHFCCLQCLTTDIPLQRMGQAVLLNSNLPSVERARNPEFILEQLVLLCCWYITGLSMVVSVVM